MKETEIENIELNIDENLNKYLSFNIKKSIDNTSYQVKSQYPEQYEFLKRIFEKLNEKKPTIILSGRQISTLGGFTESLYEDTKDKRLFDLVQTIKNKLKKFSN